MLISLKEICPRWWAKSRRDAPSFEVESRLAWGFDLVASCAVLEPWHTKPPLDGGKWLRERGIHIVGGPATLVSMFW